MRLLERIAVTAVGLASIQYALAGGGGLPTTCGCLALDATPGTNTGLECDLGGAGGVGVRDPGIVWNLGSGTCYTSSGPCGPFLKCCPQGQTGYLICDEFIIWGPRCSKGLQCRTMCCSNAPTLHSQVWECPQNGVSIQTYKCSP